jgi:hypothetical protein
VAVIQISRIQVRRGQENAGSGLPQLASGEIGWGIDTQKMYIGNGSVSEGSPTVGNTEILTEHTDIFSLIDTYTYGADEEIVQTGIDPTSPVQRTLQERLDEQVSVASFGAPGDGTVQTAALQRAVDQLFINNATKGSAASRVVLYLSPGNYVVDDTIYLPPYASLVGAGKDKTIITSTASTPIFQTVNSSSTPGSPANDATSTTVNQAKYISVKGMTLETTQSANAILLQSCTDSLFEDLKFTGTWETGDSIVSANIAIQLKSLTTIVTSSKNEFINCEFIGYSYGIESKFDITNNHFDRCVFQDLGYGVVFGNGTNGGLSGELTGPLNNSVANSEFRDIDRNAIVVNNGKFNVSENNHYYNVGNNGGAESVAVYSIIKFDEASNRSVGDYMARFEQLSSGQGFINDDFVPDYEGNLIADQGFSYEISIVQAGSNTTLFKLPVDSDKVFEIEYFYRSTQVNAMRHGVLRFTCDRSFEEIQTTDEFEYTGDASFITNLTFDGAMIDADADTDLDTLVVKYENTTTADSGSILFKVKTFSLV